jgi:ketosteroid isomerase-like protein
MSLDANKTAAVALLQGLARGELPRAAMSDDAAWWVQGRSEMAIDDFSKVFGGFASLLGDGGRMVIHGVTAEGDKVAVEAESFFPLKDGRLYNNTYHFLVEFRGDKVRRVKEYCNTAVARDTFGG